MKISFASHPKSTCWSSRNEGSPEDYALNSHKKCWFDCECGHEFEMRLKDINLGLSWCPYCAVPTKKLCNNTCVSCYNKSFASHYRAKYFSDKNTINPRMISLKTHKKYLFNCECGHEFEAILADITNNDSWCSYCSNKKLCINIQNCISCYNKTFASIDKSNYWSIKNTKKPIEVFKSSAEKFIFDCGKCKHEFKSRLSHITDGSWCPHCRYKTEDKLTKILKEYFPLLITQAKYDWCKNKKHLPFDFCLEDKKIIIECDGENHWKQVAKWKTPEHNHIRDVYKMKCANENGYSVIRIVQEDVFKDKYNWLQELLENIDKIVLENRVQNIYMCKKDEYKDFDISI
jgi:very-short-patch-repair endonuclease